MPSKSDSSQQTTSPQPSQPQLSDSSSSKSNPRSYRSPPLRVQVSFPGPGRTKQSFKDECDINNIMGRYMITGQLSHLAQMPPQYSDVTGLDFQTAMDVVVNANAMFANLPSSIRDRFANDPGRFLTFMEDENNRPEAVRLGLLDDLSPQAAPLASPPLNAAMAPVAPSRTPAPAGSPGEPAKA